MAEKNKGGRPRKEIDWALVDNLCAVQCTGEEIAAILEVNYDTLNRACKREKTASFAEYFKVKSVNGRASLRRAQFKAATKNLNPTMLIWLGKQMLGQKDTQYLGGDGDNPLVVTMIERKIVKADDTHG